VTSQRQRRRTVLLGAMAAVLTAAAAACSTPGAATQEASAPARLLPAKLTYLHQWSQNQGHGPKTDELAARFSAQFAPIEVESVYTTDYLAKLAAMITSGDMPDVATYNLAFLPRLEIRPETGHSQMLL
jgi:ABC-type glycerol-3-phosphate transport system substrate-binding protein